MHFSARSALIVSSCLALGVHALPVTYSVVDVDGGSGAAAPTPTAGSGSGSGPGTSADSSADEPATVYHTVTKSTEVEEPEATTVSVSVTIVETKHAMPKPTNASSSSLVASASSSSLPSKASAKAPSTTSVPSSTSTSDALSVLASAQSTFMTRHPSGKPSPPAESATGSATLSEDYDAANVSVTADVPSVTETIISSQAHSMGETVTLLSTTTVVTDAAPTSYYDDGMWHTRYAIKPSAAPEKPAAKVDDAAPKIKIVFEAAGKNKPASEAEDPASKVADVPPRAEEEKQPAPQTNETLSDTATNTTSQATNGTYHARRQLQPIAATPTMNEVAGTGVPEILVHPIRPQPSGIVPHVEPNVIAARAAAPTGDATALGDALSADVDSKADSVAERAAPMGYSVVSWNETTQA